MDPMPVVAEHPQTHTVPRLTAPQLYPPVANPQLSLSAIKAQVRIKPSWLYGYLFKPNQFILDEQMRSRNRNPSTYHTAEELIARMENFQKSVLEKTGLPENSWVTYCKGGEITEVLILGVGFDQVLHRPLKPGVVERAKEALERTDDPKWFLFDDKHRYESECHIPAI